MNWSKNAGDTLTIKTLSVNSIALASLALAGVLAAVPAIAIEIGTAESHGVNLTTGEYAQMTEGMVKAYGSPLTLSAAAFRSDGYNPAELLYLTSYDMLLGGDTENAFAVAPVYLPHGATISSVGAAAHDGIGTTGACSAVEMRDVSVWLIRVDNYTGDLAQMSYQTTTGQSADPQYLLDTDVEYDVVDYPTYSYYAVVKLCHSAQAFYTMQIFYTLP